MKCYNHPETDAVGICKSCFKAICRDCLTDTGNGIACTANCVEEVRVINLIAEKNKSALKNDADGNLLWAIFMFVFALILFYKSREDEQAFEVSIAASVFMVISIWLFYKAYKAKKQFP